MMARLYWYLDPRSPHQLKKKNLVKVGPPMIKLPALPVPSTSCDLKVTYAPAKFEVAMSNGLGEDNITRKYILLALTLGPVTQNIAQYRLPEFSLVF